ncbi:YwqG family protein [Abditibacterium utsteinense]|nr:YwqG family protein [Abditibacterium utsteinense]
MSIAEDFAQKRAEAVELIRTHAPARLQEPLIELLRPAIALCATRAEDSQIPIGASKFGGAPDVPLHFLWPTWNEKPLGFLAQINLEEVAPFDVEELLPKSGLLSFFYEMEEPLWGEAEQKEGWRVFFFEHDELQRQNSTALNELFSLHSSLIKFEIAPSLPNDSSLFKQISLEEEEDEQMEKFDEEISLSKSHQMLGHAHSIQNEPAVEAEEWSISKTPAMDWILLFQVDSDDELGAMWGDVGTIYFLISKQDLAARRFEATWHIMQC